MTRRIGDDICDGLRLPGARRTVDDKRAAAVGIQHSFYLRGIGRQRKGEAVGRQFRIQICRIGRVGDVGYFQMSVQQAFHQRVGSEQRCMRPQVVPEDIFGKGKRSDVGLLIYAPSRLFGDSFRKTVKHETHVYAVVVLGQRL